MTLTYTPCELCGKPSTKTYKFVVGTMHFTWDNLPGVKVGRCKEHEFNFPTPCLGALVDG